MPGRLRLELEREAWGKMRQLCGVNLRAHRQALLGGGVGAAVGARGEAEEELLVERHHVGRDDRRQIVVRVLRTVKGFCQQHECIGSVQLQVKSQNTTNTTTPVRNSAPNSCGERECTCSSMESTSPSSAAITASGSGPTFSPPARATSLPPPVHTHQELVVVLERVLERVPVEVLELRVVVAWWLDHHPVRSSRTTQLRGGACCLQWRTCVAV